MLECHTHRSTSAFVTLRLRSWTRHCTTPLHSELLLYEPELKKPPLPSGNFRPTFALFVSCLMPAHEFGLTRRSCSINVSKPATEAGVALTKSGLNPWGTDGSTRTRLLPLNLTLTPPPTGVTALLEIGSDHPLKIEGKQVISVDQQAIVHGNKSVDEKFKKYHNEATSMSVNVKRG